MSRLKLFIKLFVALIAAAALWYVWIILSAKLELGGGSPDRQTLGSVKDIRQRAMTQFCTGVVVTPQGTWLVGRVETDAKDLQPSANVVDLDAVLYGKPQENKDQDPEESGTFSSFLSPRQKETTFISRLNAQGQFELVAHVSDPACLVASPDGNRVFLLSGLDRPESDTPAVDDKPQVLFAGTQSAVFRTDDQGKHWSWLPKGFFSEADHVAWNLKPYFHGENDVWAWSSPSASSSEDEAPPEAISTGVFYSADGGATNSEIFASESLLVSLAYAQGKRPDITQWHSDSSDNGEVRTHVTQLDAQHAFIWVSQRFWGSDPSVDGHNLAVSVTTRVRLKRDAGQWQVESVQRDDGLFIDAMVDNGSGRVMGLIDQGDQGQDRVGELDTAKLSWHVVGELPSVFGQLGSHTQLREEHFWMGQNSLLINTSSNHHPPRWLYWWSKATISADGVFYSTDWGRSWQQLAVDGYLGILGFQPAQDRVFWAKGNWYNSNDLGIYSYGLR
ncbi:hypothetical protein NLK61_11885 [Pseudomonas fuscovaginae UPB0736]|uniref:hypothetical protein n=1 Tax=Pseudomonas asplenii TaxID=53407 RepID=UPI000289705C|nr:MULTISPECIES: hypothetical protein [Pseudomonas]UUQ67295.1 hypothetical protein NLK61_11885 [Pseudomonas fuscovaginae UPB0736]UZE29435.1 hypothetical protein LOY63_01390 [Pseudomonas asplenii]